MTGDLFENPESPAKPGRRAPAELNPAQLHSLAVWAEEHVPWIARGALESLTPIEEYTDACLSHFAGKRTMRPNWVGTVKNWIRRDERPRLEKMAKHGNESARLALRNPNQWRDSYDRQDRQIKSITPDITLISPRPEQTIPSVTIARRA